MYCKSLKRNVKLSKKKDFPHIWLTLQHTALQFENLQCQNMFAKG